MKEKIRYHALRLFDQNGFHGTSMRDIGDAAGCKSPTVYHYYESKENLFDEIVRVEYEALVDKLGDEIPKGLSLKESSIYRIKRKKTLSADEKLVYRLAIKTWLGFEGCETTRQKLLQWEQARYEKNMENYSEVTSSMLWIKFITRSITNMIIRIILLGENPTDDEIQEEISIIFEVASHNNKKERT